MSASPKDHLACLLVDDDPQGLALYQRDLRGCNIVTAQSGAEALAILARRQDIAVLVTSMSMPDLNGIELLRRVQVECPQVVLIMLTEELDQDAAQHAINTGHVFRFLRKPCPATELRRAIDEGSTLFRTRLEAEKKRLSLEVEIDLHKNTDTITGLANRAFFKEKLADALTDANKRRDVILCLDINHFHLLNELHSFVAGDALLRRIANILQVYSRDNDIVSRTSNDVFVMYLLNCDSQKVNFLIDAIRRDIAHLDFSWQGNRFDVTASIGAIPLHSPAADANMLMRLIEIATKIAKEQGRDSVYISSIDDPELQKRLEEMGYFSHINTLISQQRLRLYYQTIRSINDDKTGLHFELLLRVIDENNQHHSPVHMLNAAEKYILSEKIDRWVIDAAVAFFSQNPHITEKLNLCSINLSANSLRNVKMADYINMAFASAGLNPENFCFEITETAAVINLESAIGFVKLLHQKGFKIAIDDFGTGHSSFAYLKHFSFDYLKIDGVFIQNLQHDKVNEAITSAINHLAHTLGKKTIAEYVESEETVSLLRSMGVDYIQGYHVGVPQAIENLVG
ncbi:EAL domain-containing protein [Spongiibacter sp. KMU-166]|uniref:EAL domain-containing protein n=1 Tax=Spongiibacter thalassae TaxID=2721624 RepID=A0ABX1GGC6_9GAMM|nr:EAL domain-containing protein [Spongiibacter thalassae]NKI18260.1 EAL domain-containing protein [Spongiibacter thalassae]